MKTPDMILDNAGVRIEGAMRRRILEAMNDFAYQEVVNHRVKTLAELKYQNESTTKINNILNSINIKLT